MTVGLITVYVYVVQSSYFFGYMSVISYAFFIMLGSIGFYR